MSKESTLQASRAIREHLSRLKNLIIVGFSEPGFPKIQNSGCSCLSQPWNVLLFSSDSQLSVHRALSEILSFLRSIPWNSGLARRFWQSCSIRIKKNSSADCRCSTQIIFNSFMVRSWLCCMDWRMALYAFWNCSSLLLPVSFGRKVSWVCWHCKVCKISPCTESRRAAFATPKSTFRAMSLLCCNVWFFLIDWLAFWLARLVALISWVSLSAGKPTGWDVGTQRIVGFGSARSHWSYHLDSFAS